MPNAKQASSRGKSLFFGGCAAFALLLFTVYSTDTPPAMSASRISATGATPPTASRPADSPSALSPFAALTCLSADCSPLGKEALPEVTNDELPRRTVIYSYLEKIRNGDAAALAAVRQVLDNCLQNHRNRLVTNTAFGIVVPAEIDECEVSELAEFATTTDEAVRRGFNPATARDSNAKIARLGWMASIAQLDDAARQVADLPRLQPDATGTVFFADVPPPKRQSPFWKDVAMFAKEYGPSDPEILSMAEALAEPEDGAFPTVGSSQ